MRVQTLLVGADDYQNIRVSEQLRLQRALEFRQGEDRLVVHQQLAVNCVAHSEVVLNLAFGRMGFG